VRPPRPRQNSSTLFPTVSGSNGGWNDPPSTLLGAGTPLHNSGLGYGLGLGYEDTPAPSRSMTPSSTGRYEAALSRNSSRVNLHDMGLAQRCTSRAATPARFDDDHTS